MRWFEKMSSVRRHVVVGGALVAMLIAGVVLGTALTASRAEAQGRSFTGDAALMLHFVKPAQASEFERVMARVNSALDTTRQNQARGWKVYRSDTDLLGQGNIMYVWVIDPVVSNGDYAVANILNEAFPDEVYALYEAYNTSYTDGPTKQVSYNLQLVEDFGR